MIYTRIKTIYPSGKKGGQVEDDTNEMQVVQHRVHGAKSNKH